MVAMRSVASIMFLVATTGACGDSTVHHLADGGADASARDAAPVDGPSLADAAAPDAAIDGPISIVVTVGGQPSAGATVYFQGADSSLVAEQHTGSDGGATQIMAPGGFVSVVDPTALGVDTFAGVKPGDVLHVDLQVPPPQDSITFTLSVPSDGAAVFYELATSCGTADLSTDNDGPTQVTLAGCGGVADMMVSTADDNALPLDTLYVPGVAVADGSAIALTGSYHPSAAQTVVDIDVPPGVTDVNTQHTLFGPHGALATSPVSVFQHDDVNVFDYTQPSDPTITSAFEQVLFGGTFEQPSVQAVADWGAADTATEVTEIGEQRVPDFAAVPVFDVIAQQLQWQLVDGGSGGTVDVVYADLAFDRGGTTWSWQLVAPGSAAGALAFPQLPTDVFAFDGAAGDGISVVSVEVGHVPGGYDAVRARGLDADFDVQLAGTTPSGHLVLSYSGRLSFRPSVRAGQRVTRRDAPIM